MILTTRPPQRVALLDAAYDGHKYVYQFPPHLADDIAKQIILEAADRDHSMPWLVAAGLLESLESMTNVRHATDEALRELTFRAADPDDPMTYTEAAAGQNAIYKNIRGEQ